MPKEPMWSFERVFRIFQLGCGLLFAIGGIAYYTGAMGPDETGWGKDTVDSFGSGTFQIVRTSALDSAGNEELSLYDRKQHSALLTFVQNWQVVGDYVYAVGKDTAPSGRIAPGKTDHYVVLNLRTGVHARYEHLEEAPLVHRAELRSLGH
jgi:hypothetical protein